MIHNASKRRITGRSSSSTIKNTHFHISKSARTIDLSVISAKSSTSMANFQWLSQHNSSPTTRINSRPIKSNTKTSGNSNSVLWSKAPQSIPSVINPLSIWIQWCAAFKISAINVNWKVKLHTRNTVLGKSQVEKSYFLVMSVTVLWLHTCRSWLDLIGVFFMIVVRLKRFIKENVHMIRAGIS